MSLTSYRAAPPRVGEVYGRRCVWCVGAAVWAWCGVWCGCALGGPGGGRLSRDLGRSIMGAGGFHGRVRDGIGWVTVRQGHQVGQARAPSSRLDGNPDAGPIEQARWEPLGDGACAVRVCAVR